MRSTGGALDALSTAQLTSGYMVDSIAKGEGAAAIQLVAEDFLPLPAGVPDSAEKLIPPQRLRLQQQQQQQQQQEQAGVERHSVIANELGSGGGVEGAAIEVEGAAAAAAAAAAAEGGEGERSSSPESVGRNSISSSAETAALSRPQSLDRQTVATLTAAAAGACGVGASASASTDANANAALGAEAGAGAVRPQSLGKQPGLSAGDETGELVAVRPLLSLDGPTSEVALDAAGGVGGGGAEATAPTPRKWSKEVSPAGGGRIDAPVSPGAARTNSVGGEGGAAGAAPANGGGAAIDMWGEGVKGSLASRRMRDSIRLRAGLGAGPLPPGTTPPAGGPNSNSFILHHQPSPSNVNGTSPSSHVGTGTAAAVTTTATSPGLFLDPSAAANLPPPVPTAAAAAGAAGGALGAAAGSAKSGGEPAESEQHDDRSFEYLRRKIVPTVPADLPPRDSTAGEADLGWGAEGLPADLASVEGSSGGSSSTMRSPKLLRFRGAGAGAGGAGGGGGGFGGNGEEEERKRRKEAAKRSGRRQQQGRDLFCLPVAREPAAGGADGGSGEACDAPAGGAGVEGDVYRNYDNVSLDDAPGIETRKRTGTFCMPGNTPLAGEWSRVGAGEVWLVAGFRAAEIRSMY